MARAPKKPKAGDETAHVSERFEAVDDGERPAVESAAEAVVEAEPAAPAPKRVRKSTRSEAVADADPSAAPVAAKKPSRKKSAVAASPAADTDATATVAAESATDPDAAPAAVAAQAVEDPALAVGSDVAVEVEPVADVQPAPAFVGPAFPGTDYTVVEKLLVGFLDAEVRKVGLARAVLGLSGGIDSAVSAAIAARALGPENVLGVMMPYAASSPESVADAKAVAANLGIETLLVDITPQVDAYFALFPDASKLRRGNKMARERMTILYDHSAVRGALVIGTSNKTELLLGYGTLYGDMASALNPIGDLYKTQVWGLARHLGLPASVIDKAPTADLWSGQTDEHELGFSYHEVDRLLFRMIDERCSTDELLDLGFEAAFVEKVARMVRTSQFKRRLPVIAKLSARSIDTDFRYSRDWGL